MPWIHEPKTVIDAYPRLTIYGFHYWGFKPNPGEDLVELRARLYSEEMRDQYKAIIDWMDEYKIKKTKNINMNCPSSYGLKHIIFDFTGYHYNGVFIVACLMADFKGKIYGPNMYFNMGVKEWKAARSIAQERKLARWRDEESRVKSAKSWLAALTLDKPNLRGPNP